MREAGRLTAANGSADGADRANDAGGLRVLVYGYGNPGRQDDGLGVALADALEQWARSRSEPGRGGRPSLVFDRNFQLNVEDALAAASYDIVVFLDASQDQADPIRFRPIHPAADRTFSTHAMSPQSVMALCRELYGARPAGRLLTIRGYSWEPNGAMTEGARFNLAAAKAWLMPLLESPDRLLDARL